MAVVARACKLVFTSNICQDEGVFLEELGRLTFVLLLLLLIETRVLLLSMLAMTAIYHRILDGYRIISVCLDMLFQVLRPLEGFSTKVASMRFQRDVDANV